MMHIYSQLEFNPPPDALFKLINCYGHDRYNF